MVKKLLVSGLVLLVLVLACWKLFFSNGNVEEELKNLNMVISSYHMEANMEIGQGEEIRKFYVSVDYEDSQSEHFRISLTDKDINQEQILLRNDEGVYVLTPVLNQVYTFTGDYPLNSNKPYLYHSYMNMMKGDYDVNKLQDGYLLSFDVCYENEPTWIKQELKLSKELKPVWTYIYNSDNAVVAKVLFTKVDFSPTFEENYFNVEKNMSLAKENISSSHVSTSIDDLPLIPSVDNDESTLKEQTKIVEDDKVSYILTYEGEKSYTVFQSLISPNENEDYISIKVDANIVPTMYGIGFIEGKCLKYIYHDVSYEIYSSDLTISEMVNVVKNMEIVGVK